MNISFLEALPRSYRHTAQGEKILKISEISDGKQIQLENRKKIFEQILYQGRFTNGEQVHKKLHSINY